jgi:hypothetical protein
MDIENIDLFPFVLSLSKHERGFAGQAQYNPLFPLKDKFNYTSDHFERKC